MMPPAGAGLLARAALVSALLLSGQMGCRQAAPPPAPSPESGSPSLLLVTIDTWRWDYIGASGSGKVATPTLDRLAREGVYEREAVTPCPLTTPAHASILTGLLPLHHGVVDCTCFPLDRSIPTLAEAFGAAGYRTAAFVSSVTLAARFGLGRGFGLYDDSGIKIRVANDLTSARRPGGEVTDAALSYLKGLGPEPAAFVWVHYFDLHLPYEPLPDFDARYPSDPYAARAAFVDDQVGRLLAGLPTAGGRRWRVVVVGDHGEAFGEHNEEGHGYGLYRPTLNVPLILHPKPERPLRHPAPWSLTDLSPTLREWFGLPAAARTDGASLFADGPVDRQLPLVSLLPSFMFGVNPSLGLREGRWVYLSQGKEGLYDLESDPDQQRNLWGRPGTAETAARLKSACARALPPGRIASLLGSASTAPPEDLAGLSGLGYTAGHPVAMAELQHADLEGVLAAYRKVVKAQDEMMRTGASAGLEAAYAAFLARYPRSAEIYAQQGKILLARGDLEGAREALRRAAKLNPNDFEALMNLGAIEMTRGRFDDARVLLTSALALNAQDARIHLNLGILYYSHLQQPGRARFHFERFLELSPASERAPKIREIVEAMKAAGIGPEGDGP